MLQIDTSQFIEPRVALPKCAAHARRSDHRAAPIALAKQVLGVEDAMEVRAGVAAARPGWRIGAVRGEGVNRNHTEHIAGVRDEDHTLTQCHKRHYAAGRGTSVR